MITMTTVAVFLGTRLRSEYVAPPAQPTGVHTWQPCSPSKFGDFGIDNSTGVSEVECRHT